MRAEIQLNSRSSFRVGFEGIVGGGDKTDIALDDISFSAGCYKVSRSNNWGSNAMKVEKRNGSLERVTISRRVVLRTVLAR